MGTERSTDKRGRITIPSELRDRFGDRYRVVGLEDGIKLVPIPNEPIERLRESASDDLRSASLEELRDAVRGRDGGSRRASTERGADDTDAT